MDYFSAFALAFIVGCIITYLLARVQFNSTLKRYQDKISHEYVPKVIYDDLKSSVENKDIKIETMSKSLSAAETDLKNMEEKTKVFAKELEEQRTVFRTEFKNLANDLLEQKSKKFADYNEKQISDILNPLKEKIQQFEKRVEDTHKVEIRERATLKSELENIIKLNQQVSEQANRLSNALTGDKKLQGNWGEVQLDMILQRAGLQKGVHYDREVVAKDQTGQTFRPDYIIYLPEDKHLIIDSKVSLVDYEKYHNAEDDKERDLYLKAHCGHVMNHIKSLSQKNYQHLTSLQSPDYVLLFVPIEPALTNALKFNPSLFDYALERNIVLVSVTTLLATMRTVSFIWKQENQRKNVLDIARESGALYDKFVGFLEDLDALERSIHKVKKDYDTALNKLHTSPKRGQTIIGRIERIKQLGADATKSIPAKFLDESE